MASLQLRHSRSCAAGKAWSPVDQEIGCDCQPTFYVVVRQGSKRHAEKAGKNRKNAERALTKLQSQEDEGAYTPQKRIRFSAWADQWLASLERKASTVEDYRTTMEYAKECFGDKDVREIGTADVAAFNQYLRSRKNGTAPISDSTRAKHLRVLSACLNSATQHGYAGSNPVATIPKGEKPRPRKKESAYFTNDEFPRLFAEIPDEYRALFQTALGTGMRQGELAALTWADVDLTDSLVQVRHNFTNGELGTPKNHEQRSVDLTSEVVALLGRWWGESGCPDEGLVFPAVEGGHLPYWRFTDVLYAAMQRAGIPRVGPTGELRTFHSLRHTYARMALESGCEIFWLARQLGHSSVTVTVNRYGHWERKAAKRETEKLEGQFVV